MELVNGVPLEGDEVDREEVTLTAVEVAGNVVLVPFTLEAVELLGDILLSAEKLEFVEGTAVVLEVAEPAI